MSENPFYTPEIRKTLRLKMIKLLDLRSVYKKSESFKIIS